MSQYENFGLTCDRCQLDLDRTAFVDESLICPHCGHTQSHYENDGHHRSQKQFLWSIAAISIFLVFAFIHIVNWDSHSLQVIPLQIKYALGLSSPQDLRTYAEICQQRMKYNCTESALSHLAAQGAEQEDLIKLGNLRRKLDLHAQALLAYDEALKKETNRLSANTADIHFGLAKSYQALQQPDQAARHYDLALKAKPNVIQITVLESYIQMLMATGKADKAKQVLAKARERSGSQRLLASIKTN